MTDRANDAAAPASFIRTVLIADKVAAAECELVSRLKREGYTVMIAGDVAAAQEHIRTMTIDYAVCDLQFTDGGGFEIVEALYVLHPSCRTIVYSEYCNLATAVRAARLGAADVLPKPTNMDFLIAILLNRDLTPTELATLPDPDAVKLEYIQDIYSANGFNVARTAEQVSMHRRTLQRLMKRNGCFDRKASLDRAAAGYGV